MNTMRSLLSLVMASVSTMAVQAGDVPHSMPVPKYVMPTLGTDEFGTDEDNENNAGTGTPDGDMDVYLYNGDAGTPIEFNINIPFDPSGQAGTLVMNVYDVDSDALTDPEVDNVSINGVHVGVLSGTSDTWGYNRFAIPIGLLVQGNNKVQIDIDINNGGWAVTIDWAMITGLSSTGPKLGIQRCWISPIEASPGEYVNFYAEITGEPGSVWAYNGEYRLVEMKDPDGDGVYWAQWQIPKTKFPVVEYGWKKEFRMRAKSPTEESWCPGLKIVKP